jgi:hypothetical protein
MRIWKVPSGDGTISGTAINSKSLDRQSFIVYPIHNQNSIKEVIVDQSKNEILMDKNELSRIMEKIEKVNSEGPFFIRQKETDTENTFPDEEIFEIEVPLTINGIFGLFTFKV